MGDFSRLQKIAFFLMMSSLAAFAGGCGQEEAPGPPDPFAEVASLLRQSSAAYRGQAILLVMQEGEEIYRDSLGGMSQEDPLLVASASKWVSAAVVLAVADEGLFELDDPVANYLPAFDQPLKRDITIRQAFSMTSGLEECTALSPSCPTSSNSITLAQSVQRVAEETDMATAPGTGMYYGSLGMQVAGRVCEVATGKDWEQLFQEKIAVPCGMGNSHYGQGSNPKVGGSLRTSASDYLKFLDMICHSGEANGQQVLSGEAVAEFFREQAPGTPVLYSPLPANPPHHPYQADTVRYGFGCWLDVQQPGTGLAERISSPGAFGTYPWYDRRRNLYGVIFTRSSLQATLAHSLHLIALASEAADNTEG